MLVPGRNYATNSYRYGFQGQEKDDEVKGEGNHYDFGGYGLDTRIGRRWSLDPIDPTFESRYVVYRNNPNYFIDPDGQWSIKHKTIATKRGGDGRRSKKITFEYVLRTANEQSLELNSTLGYYPAPVVTFPAALYTIGEGYNTNNPGIIAEGIVDLGIAFVGEKLGEKLVPSLRKAKSTVAQKIAKYLSNTTLAEVADAAWDADKSIYVDKYVQAKLMSEGIVNEKGEFSKKHINEIKSKLNSKGDYDLNKRSDRRALDYAIQIKLNKEVKVYSKEGINSYNNLNKDKINKRKKRHGRRSKLKS